MSRKTVRSLIGASAGSLLLLVGNYFVNNSDKFTWEFTQLFRCLQLQCENCGINSQVFNCDDALFIDVSYDRELVEKYDDGVRIGNTSIADRSKLYRALRILKDKGEYKYIILDLLFDAEEKSASDSLLYPLIASMDNIVISREDGVCIPPDLEAKSAWDNYTNRLGSESIRFKYLRKDGRRSIPLKVYEDLHPDSNIWRHGPLYTSGGKLCYNTNFVLFDSHKLSRVPITGNVASDYFDLGTCFLDGASGERRLLRAAKDHYVIFGTLSDKLDEHDTYMGSKQGSLILYRALKSLENGDHIVRFYPWMLIWWLVFAIIWWFVTSGRNLTDLFPASVKESALPRKVARFKPLRFIIASVGYSLILYAVSCFEYVFAHRVYNMVLPSLVFMCIKFIVDYRRLKY